MPSNLELFAARLLLQSRYYNEDDRTYFRARIDVPSNAALNELASRVGITENDIVAVNAALSELNFDLDSLTERVGGLESGNTYTVPNLADLPATVNPGPEVIFAEVYHDSVSDSNNGRYYQEVGSSTWFQIEGDLTNRVVNLEYRTAIFDVSKDNLWHKGQQLRWVCMSPNGDLYWAVAMSGKLISKHDHPDATETVSGFMSFADKKLLVNLPFQNLPQEFIDGAPLAVSMRTEDGKVYFYKKTTDGVVHIPELQVRKHIGPFTADSVKIGDGGYEFKVRTDLPGWFYCLLWQDDKLAYGIRRLPDGSGETVIPNLVVPPPLPASIVSTMLANGSVTPEKLSDEVVRSISNDYIEEMPDDVRSFEQDGMIGVYTGSNWKVLPRMITPVIEGINNAQTSLDFRKTSGLLIGGQRRRGTYDVGAVGPSITYRGTIWDDSVWPPVGTFVDGDFYNYTDDNPRVISPNTLYLGDLMIRVGGAWVYKAGPGSNTTVLRRDWWEVLVSGIHEGITLVAGDRLVYVGYQSSAGLGWRRWRKGLPSSRECFRCGSFNPSSGLPTTPTPLDRDLWDVSAAGSAGGFTFSANDMLLRMGTGVGSVWCHIPMGPIKTVPDLTGFLLTCDYTSAEWEVIRTDRSTVSRGVWVSMRGSMIQRQSTDGIGLVGYADSMGGQVFPQVAIALGRPVTNNSYGAGTADEIEAMAEWHISQGDPHKGKPLITIIGNNTGGNHGETIECRLKLERMMATGDNRFVHCSILGTRIMEWDGTRLKCPNFEEQWIQNSTNTNARDIRYLRATRPNNHIWSAYSLGQASVGDTSLSIQWPGKTNEQVWNEYRIPAVKYCRSISPANGLDYCITYMGPWSTPGLPSPGTGSSGQYYIAIGGASVAIGFLIVNILGTWTYVIWDTTHLNVAGDTIQGIAIADFYKAKKW